MNKILYLLIQCLCLGLYSQKCICETKYYYDVIEYALSDSFKNSSFIPEVTTNLFINDSIFINQVEQCDFKFKENKLYFNSKDHSDIKFDTFLIRNSDIYLIKKNQTSLMFSKGLFDKKQISTYYVEEIINPKTNLKVGTIKDCLLPLNDTIINKEKMYLYSKGYIVKFDNDSDLANNYSESRFIELYTFYYKPGYGEVYQFSLEKYNKFHLINESKECRKCFKKVFRYWK